MKRIIKTNNKAIRNGIICIIVLVAILIFAMALSYGDINLAEKLDGTWMGSITISYDDQSKEEQDVYQKFDYSDDTVDNDGSMFEVRECNVKNVDLDDMTMDVKYHSYINGTWEVLDGDLSIKYDVSTLKVKVNVDDVKLHYNNALAGLAALVGMLGGYTPYDIVNDLQKELYKDLFHQYQEGVDDDGRITYSNLKVEDNNASYDASDVGTLHLVRTNVNINSILK